MSTIHTEITAKIVAKIESNPGSWSRPWQFLVEAGTQRNVAGRPYSGINVLILAMEGRSSPVWGTFKAWQGVGACVRKGEKGTRVTIFKPTIRKDATTGEEKESVFLTTFCVFNAEQVDGYVEAEPVAAPTPAERNARCDALIAATGAKVSHGGNKACYIPSIDAVQMPPAEAYKSVETYYSTMFHELTHWTGAKNRLDRNQSGRFGSKNYAEEEIVAELGAAFLSCSTGVVEEPTQDNAAYMASWLASMKADPTYVFKAAAAASKAAAFILACEVNEEEAKAA